MSDPGSLELILQDEVQKLLDNFASVIHAHVTFFSADGKVLRQGRNEGNCRFCQLVQKKMSVKLCKTLDAEKQELARRTGHCQTYLCHAGLWEATMPLKNGDELLGYIMFGQFRKSERLPEQLYSVFRTVAERKKLEEAFQNLPMLSAEAMENLTGLMNLLVNYILKNELVTRGGDHLYNAIDGYLNEYLTENITLSGMAHHLGRSISTIAHFLSTHHTSFKSLLIRKRLAYAEKKMKQQPDSSIKEIALESGFHDPYYFSRIYRKYRGVPPTGFRDGKK